MSTGVVYHLPTKSTPANPTTPASAGGIVASHPTAAASIAYRTVGIHTSPFVHIPEGPGGGITGVPYRNPAGPPPPPTTGGGSGSGSGNGSSSGTPSVDPYTLLQDLFGAGSSGIPQGQAVVGLPVQQQVPTTSGGTGIGGLILVGLAVAVVIWLGIKYHWWAKLEKMV